MLFVDNILVIKKKNLIGCQQISFDKGCSIKVFLIPNLIKKAYRGRFLETYRHNKNNKS